MLAARRLAVLLLVFGAAIVLASDAAPTAPAGKENRKSDKAAKYIVETLQGRVVWLAEAMARRMGVESVDEARERTLAIETKDGKLVPLVEDVRGRAFRADERLRKMDIELSVRRYENAPAVQIVSVYSLKKDGKYELDYWCDICAIAMFEEKPCECCQGPNRLRERRVE